MTNPSSNSRAFLHGEFIEGLFSSEKGKMLHLNQRFLEEKDAYKHTLQIA